MAKREELRRGDVVQLRATVEYVLGSEGGDEASADVKLRLPDGLSDVWLPPRALEVAQHNILAGDRVEPKESWGDPWRTGTVVALHEGWAMVMIETGRCVGQAISVQVADLVRLPPEKAPPSGQVHEAFQPVIDAIRPPNVGFATSDSDNDAE